MDYKIIWTNEALTDIESIAKFIAKDSVLYASSVVSKILDTTDTIKSYPYSGRIVPEENKETLREFFVYNYRLIYEIKENTIYILAIVHGKRLLNDVIEKRIK